MTLEKAAAAIAAAVGDLPCGAMNRDAYTVAAQAALAAFRDGVEAGPPWLSDAAEALGRVTPDGKPLALNWTQVLAEIRAARARVYDLERELAEAQRRVSEFLMGSTASRLQRELNTARSSLATAERRIAELERPWLTSAVVSALDEAQHTGWPLSSVLRHLVDAADILFDHYDYDGHGWELPHTARTKARLLLEALSPNPEEPSR